MVRPFFRWMVSARAPARASNHTQASFPIKRMVTRSRIQAHSSNGGQPNHVTKVLVNMRGLRVAAAIWLAAVAAPAVRAAAENLRKSRPRRSICNSDGVGLDPTRVYQVRGASLDRSAVHITLEDGTIGFTQDVMGRITGAFFEGYGEVLLTPPNEVERRSMSLFTGMAILEEHFATAYFRFNDDAAKRIAARFAGDRKEAGVCRTLGSDGAESSERGCHQVADDLQPDASGERQRHFFRASGCGARRERRRSVSSRAVARNQARRFRRLFRFSCARTGSGRTGESGRERRSLLRHVDIIFARRCGAVSRRAATGRGA